MITYILMYILCGILWGLYFGNKLVANTALDTEGLNERILHVICYSVTILIVTPLWPYIIVNTALKKIINR